MINLKFSPKEAIAEAANNVLKVYLIANGSDEQVASMLGDTVSGVIKGFSIEKKQSVRKALDTAINNTWVEIISKKEFDDLEEKCKTELKQNVISSKTVFEALNYDDPEGELRRRIIPILRAYTNWNDIDLKEYARFTAEQLLIALNDEIEDDGILTLLNEIEKLRKDFMDKMDTLEAFDLALFQNVSKMLDKIVAIITSSKEESIIKSSVPELFWNAGKTWYKEVRKPGSRFHSLDIVNHILPSAENKPAESEYCFPFRATDTNENTIQCARFSELLQDKNSIYHQGHFMLIGEGGIGKTTTLMSAMQDAYEDKDTYKGEQVIPLFIELSLSPDSQDSHAYDGTSSSVIHRLIYAMLQRKDSKKDHSDLLRECMNDGSSIARDTVRELLVAATDDERRYVLLIDGLNEVSPEPFTGRSSSAQWRILQEIREIIEKYPNVTVILTGRQGAFIDYPSFHLFYLRGLIWEEIEEYLREKGKSDEEISLIRDGDKGLLKVLSIPMFLTMYVLLHGTEGITTRGELLKVFFHERFERKKNEHIMHRQSDISERIEQDEEQSVSGKMTRGNITLPMQWMFLDILVPEIAANMKTLHSFQISEDKVCLLLESLFTSPDSLYCGQYKKYAKHCFKRQLDGVSIKSIIIDFTKAYDQDEDRYGEAFLKYCESSLGILYREGEDIFGFVHQHFLDYFAAVNIINRMKIARMASEEGDKDAARDILRVYEKTPFNPLLISYIGEYLGEHHNIPILIEDMPDTGGVIMDSLNERMLITSLLDTYRGTSQKNSYVVYNLIEILKRVRKDLSNLDLHALDLIRCHFKGIRMDSVPGTNFTDSVIRFGNWFAEGHTDWLNYAEFSSDGKYIVTASYDGSARIWNVATGNLLHTLKGHTDWVNTAEFSSDGKYIVTASYDGSARIWITATGKLLHSLVGHIGRVNTAEFNNDGKSVITASADGSARIWDAITGNLLHILEGHSDCVNTAKFSMNGKNIVTASNDGSARIWDATTGNLLHILEGHTDCVNTAEFSSDGKLVVTTSRFRSARIWSTVTGKLIHVLDGHAYWVNTAEFTQDIKYIVTASYDGNARIWDSVTGEMLHTLEGHTGRVNSAKFSIDGKRIVTASWDHTAKIWDTTTGKALYTLEGHTGRLNTAEFSKDGKFVVTASNDGSARIWDAITGDLLYSLEGDISLVNNAKYSRDGKYIVTASYDKNARIWDAANGNLLQTLKGHTDIVKTAEFSRDCKRVVTASYDKSARIWDATTGKLLHNLKGHIGWVNTAKFSRNDAFIVSASYDGRARIWDVETGKLLHTLTGHTDRVNTAIFSRDDKCIVTASYDKSARIWDVETGRLLHILLGHTDKVYTAEFSRNGKHIVTASKDGSARIWDVETGRLLHILEGHLDRVNVARFSRDGRLIVTASYDGCARIWDVETGRRLHTLTGHTDRVNNAQFSSDGKLIVTSSNDRSARIWDVDTGIQLYSLEGHTDLVNNAEFSRDGKRIITSSNDRSARIWDTETGLAIRTLYEVSALYIKGIDFTHISPYSEGTDRQKEIFRQYGAILY